MTNSPPYDEQLALARYWRLAGGRALPGTHRPADRFLNALHYLGAINKTDDEPVALAHVRGIMKRVTVPYGIPKVRAGLCTSDVYIRFCMRVCCVA